MQNNQPSEDLVRGVRGLTDMGKALSLVVILVWIALFTAGLIVNSAPYRNRISSAPSAVEQTDVTADSQTNKAKPINLYWAWTVALLCYTPSNIAFLSLFAGLLGALGRCATLHAVKADENGQDLSFPEDPFNPYLSGVLRGFFTYLIVISGLVITVQNPFSTPSMEQYVRLAGVISMASFVLSYNPKRFNRFFARVRPLSSDKETRS